MAANYSPQWATTDPYYFDKKFASPTPTPSPRESAYYFAPAATPQRPATRAHIRQGSSGGFGFSSPRNPSFSPRFTSDGQYATANVSQSRSTRKHSFSSGLRPKLHERERRSSYSSYRVTDAHGESDMDDFWVEDDGVVYWLPARSKLRRLREDYFVTVNGGSSGHRTNAYKVQGGRGFDQEREGPGYASPRFDQPDIIRPAVSGHSRHNSNPIQRPQTARPSMAQRVKTAPPTTPKATPADAKKHNIPAGYSLKNWDPEEEPILLLGSVFDANSLGKWIYDWTVYRHQPASPISEMAGEMWLLLIALAGKMKKADSILLKIRSKENKEMVEEFLDAGDRLMVKLRKLLKICESAMLKMVPGKKESLGKNAGVEFVDTLFGRERELDRSEKFMANVRLWLLRFDANCDEVIKHPSI